MAGDMIDLVQALSRSKSMTKKNVLITGLPGTGKTTLVKKLAGEFQDLNPAGFYTAEMRERGARGGFELVGLDGTRRVLSHVNIKGPDRVGKYGVDVTGFDEYLGALALSDPNVKLIIIDEIGEMECLSRQFIDLMQDVLDSGKPLIATIAQKAGGFIAEVKKRWDVKLFEVTQANRDSLLESISEYIQEIVRPTEKSL